MKLSLITLPLAALVASVAAQSDCLRDCLNRDAVKAHCKFLDTGCYCKNTAFQGEMIKCIDASCPGDKQEALKLQGSVCG